MLGADQMRWGVSLGSSHAPMMKGNWRINTLASSPLSGPVLRFPVAGAQSPAAVTCLRMHDACCTGLPYFSVSFPHIVYQYLLRSLPKSTHTPNLCLRFAFEGT